MAYAGLILHEVLAGIESHGTLKSFLADEDASSVAKRMYVADYVSAWLGVEVTLTDADHHTTFGAMRDVHMTDGATVAVHFAAKPHVSYDDCAMFLANAVGYSDGAITSPWKRLVVAYHSRSTICPALDALFQKGLGACPITRASVEVFATALVELSPEA